MDEIDWILIFDVLLSAMLFLLFNWLMEPIDTVWSVRGVARVICFIGLLAGFMMTPMLMAIHSMS